MHCKPKRKGIGGGGWRYFVRDQSLGQSGKASLKELGEKFRAAMRSGSGEHEVAVARGALGKRLAKHDKVKKRGTSIFGFRSRQLGAKRWMLKIEAFYKQTAKLSHGQVVDKLMEKYRAGTALQECVLLAKGWQRCDKKNERQMLADAAACLDRFDEQSSQKVASVCDMLPVLKRQHFKLVPDQKLCVLEWVPDKLQEQASKTCSVACQDNWFGPALDKLWRELHYTIQEPIDTEQPKEEDDEVETSTTCNAAGICLCTEVGKKLNKCRNLLLRVMKELFKTQQRRDMLAKGGACIAFKRVSNTTHAEEHQVLWFHVAMMYWKPYRPTLHRVVVVQKADESLPEYLYVQASNQP
eukprot:6465706-Amphidinium_carterae.2